jgi:hypothetical protein
MAKEYSKPELVDLNEQTCIGQGCENGSGDSVCTIGNAAISICEIGNSYVGR